MLSRQISASLLSNVVVIRFSFMMISICHHKSNTYRNYICEENRFDLFFSAFNVAVYQHVFRLSNIKSRAVDPHDMHI